MGEKPNDPDLAIFSPSVFSSIQPTFTIGPTPTPTNPMNSEVTVTSTIGRISDSFQALLLCDLEVGRVVGILPLDQLNLPPIPFDPTPEIPCKVVELAPPVITWGYVPGLGRVPNIRFFDAIVIDAMKARLNQEYNDARTLAMQQAIDNEDAALGLAMALYSGQNVSIYSGLLAATFGPQGPIGTTQGNINTKGGDDDDDPSSTTPTDPNDSGSTAGLD